MVKACQLLQTFLRKPLEARLMMMSWGPNFHAINCKNFQYSFTISTNIYNLVATALTDIEPPSLPLPINSLVSPPSKNCPPPQQFSRLRTGLPVLQLHVNRTRRNPRSCLASFSILVCSVCLLLKIYSLTSGCTGSPSPPTGLLSGAEGSSSSQSRRSRCAGFTHCGRGASLLWGSWDLPLTRNWTWSPPDVGDSQPLNH